MTKKAPEGFDHEKKNKDYAEKRKQWTKDKRVERKERNA